MYVCADGSMMMIKSTVGMDDVCRRRSCVTDLVTDYHYRDSIMT